MRFWARVEKGPDCWTWDYPGPGGYGVFVTGRKSYRAHRLSWEWAYGAIPSGLYVCHRCDTPPCVRPDHLFLGTAKDNAADRDRKGRGMHQIEAEALRQARALVPMHRLCLPLGEAAALLGLTVAQLEECFRGGELLRNPWNRDLIACSEVVRALAGTLSAEARP